MLRSIRWTLQFWHAAILIVAVVGIGSASFFEIRQARYKEVDSELEAAAQLMVASLRAPHPPDGPPPWFLMGGPDDRFGPGEDRLPPRHGFDDHPPERLPHHIEMPPGFLQRYGGTVNESRSFIVYRDANQVLASFGVPMDAAHLPKYQFAAGENKLVFSRDKDLHQILLPAPEHSKVLVSGSVKPIDVELQKLMWLLGGTGVGILLLGLTGGWWLSLFAVEPIRKMTAAAESISATHLTERIDPTKVPGELAHLARVLNAAFARLELSFARQARFTADASHELRTPLTVVLSHAQLALSRDRSADEYRQTLSTCLAASKRMKSLVDSLLLLSHADVGELALDQQPLDLGTVVSDTIAMLTPLAAERRITVQTQLIVAPVIGDPVRLGQLVTNLVSNAIRYNRDGGAVTVSLARDGDRVVLTVADTGVGISPESQAHVFDRFFRADKARSREAGGSGLGLAICKSIVDAHGGHLSLTSALGEGSRFIATFPRDPAGQGG